MAARCPNGAVSGLKMDSVGQLPRRVAAALTEDYLPWNFVPGSSSVSEPRKHHFVPVCYLKQWATSADRRLCEHKLIPSHGVKPRRTAPDGTGYEVDLYRIHGLPTEAAQNFERRFMSLVDTDASRARKNPRRADRRLDQQIA
jgi:hypothetical protein